MRRMSARSYAPDGDDRLQWVLAETGIRLIAFHLPQFHPIPQNDRWWGEGFTEWTLVRHAQPLFSGHDQPRAPAEATGYYDLTAPGILERQALLARAYGIGAFAFYHYWFSGTLLLERPLQLWLRAGPTFPFCVAWANEPWTRAWDGRSDVVLQPQMYGDASVWRRHFRYLLPAFRDARALRVGERPLFLIYRAGHIPQLAAMLDVWRQEAERHRVERLFVVAMLSGFEDGRSDVLSAVDAVCEFAPFAARPYRSGPSTRANGFIDNYSRAWEELLRIPDVHQVQFRGAFVRFDNTPRRGTQGVVYDGASANTYRHYLTIQLRRALRLPIDKRFVFVNAWNEWSEGCYLEPDTHCGDAYLAATRAALLDLLPSATRD